MGRFKTKRGVCFVDDGVLYINESFRGQLKRYAEGATASVWSVAMSLLMLVGLLWPVWYFTAVRPELLWIELVVLSVVIVLAYAIDYARGFTRPAEIPLNAITEVTFVDASMWTHKRFIVSYEEDGEIHKRRIRLPSQQFSYTTQELAAAKQLFDTADVPFSA